MLRSVFPNWKHIKINVLETLHRVISMALYTSSMVYILYNSVFLFINSFYNIFISGQKKAKNVSISTKEKVSGQMLFCKLSLPTVNQNNLFSSRL